MPTGCLSRPHLQAGTKLQTFPMGGVHSLDGSSSSGCYSLTRPNLQRMLYAALPPGIVTCNASFRSFALREDGRVEVSLAVCSSSGEGVSSTGPAGSPAGSSLTGSKAAEQVEVCDLLVGADGIRSGVRACLEGEGRLGSRTGCCSVAVSMRMPRHPRHRPCAGS